MRNIVLSLFLSFTSIAIIAQEKSIYDFEVTDISGKNFDLSTLKGKKIMIVNTASECGLTPQYEKLQAIYEKYGPDDFVIVGFPANNFMKQEPGDDEEIASFCEKNYGVTFPMMSKVSVKGDDMHPIYKFLTKKELNGYSDEGVAWNFQKYLFNEEGELIEVFHPRVQPDSEEIVSLIEE
ncbi:MAG: glutathione peroxidase [Brumimicrobium sp.]